MKDLKFRIWDNGTRKLSEPFEIGSVGSCRPYDRIEQFTGLVDRKGKMVFEGDIVKVDLLGYGNGVVVWNEHNFRFQIKFELWGQKGFSDDVDIEVVGNIHEGVKK